MNADACGFLRLEVDADACVGCGGCDLVCPVLVKRANDGEETLLWAKSKDEGE